MINMLHLKIPTEWFYILELFCHFIIHTNKDFGDSVVVVNKKDRLIYGV